MNKQQLAAKIWESANKMRSKIEANEYKDYILGFMFYKFLSDRVLEFAHRNEYDEEDVRALSEEDVSAYEHMRSELGYFIAYEHLFHTWLSKGRDFSAGDVTRALYAFNSSIAERYKGVFGGIFRTLEVGLSKLGENEGQRTKAIRDLLKLIKDIPMDSNSDYDVLGFVYEYLLEKFASNAGKKAGEFYTPHEVSQLMSEIVAYHLRDRETLSIYDPTSGSGSLLITIGKSSAKYLTDKDSIKYYAQELKENTFNLTRMNLIMRGVKVDNIKVRCGDTLEEDWPYFDESDPIGSYMPLYVDAVVSNPPYSLQWTSENKESDVRYSEYGVAPKSKADYAFLLHDLYHLRPDGIMNIVLPHGVLFRGGEEGEIRKNLIEKNKIDAIIGLPANIFYGTGIPTIIMVLRQHREEDKVLIIDASKGFEKKGKNNTLRACDIKKIVDTFKKREDVEKFARLVSREEIRQNDYNLNIPRYVDSSDDAESFDLSALMFGGIPEGELDRLAPYFQAFPSLKEALFQKDGNYYHLRDVDVKETIQSNQDVQQFQEQYRNSFDDFAHLVKATLIDQMETVRVAQAETIISEDMFTRLAKIPLVDPYEVYQLFSNVYKTVSNDMEILQTEGPQALQVVDPNMVVKKKDNTEVEVQEGWKGRILPFALVQQMMLSEELATKEQWEERSYEITSSLMDILESLSEEEKSGAYVNDSGDAFVGKELKLAVEDILKGVESEEIRCLQAYSQLSKKKDKLDFMASHPQVQWSAMVANADGTYKKTVVDNQVKALQRQYTFEEGSLEEKLVSAYSLLEEEKVVSKELKDFQATLELQTKEVIESLSHEEALHILEAHWINPIMKGIYVIPERLISTLAKNVKALGKKYAETLSDLDQAIMDTERELLGFIDELEGDADDMRGLAELKRILGGV